MATKKKPTKKTTVRRPSQQQEEKEVDENVEPSLPSLSPSQQAAVDAENARFQQFQQSLNLQYLQGRVGDLSSENASLRELVDDLQRRLQSYEDAENKE